MNISAGHLDNISDKITFTLKLYIDKVQLFVGVRLCGIGGTQKKKT